MKNYKLLFLAIGFVLFSCNNTKKTKAICDCDQLNYDGLYNHFFLTEREKAFSGKCESYYPGGKIKSKRVILNGKNDGPYTLYYPNGQIQEEGKFKENLQHGVRKIYDENGKLLETATYFYGELKK